MSPNAQVARWRLWVQQHLEGVDAFFDGVPRDGKNDSKTFFGKMYCVPYPFICVFVADDSDDVAFVTSDTFLDFAQKNARPDIMAKRELRQKLRGASSHCLAGITAMAQCGFGKEEDGG